MITPKNLRSVNLNLLPVLRELLRAQNVTHAAEALGLSQSATSGALARLRTIFGDELLVPIGRSMQITRRGAELLVPVEQACGDMEELFGREGFDPQTADRQFTLATADYVSFLLAPALIRALETSAPGVQVRFIDSHKSTLPDIAAGRVDFLLTPSHIGSMIPFEVEQLELFRDSWTVIGAKAHWEGVRELTFETFCAARHATFMLDPEAPPTHEAFILGQLGLELSDIVRVPQFSLLPFIVAESRCLALVQTRLAERLKMLAPIRTFDPPFSVPDSSVCAFWGRTLDRDPAHRWFRELLLATVTDALG